MYEGEVDVSEVFSPLTLLCCLSIAPVEGLPEVCVLVCNDVGELGEGCVCGSEVLDELCVRPPPSMALMAELGGRLIRKPSLLTMEFG